MRIEPFVINSYVHVIKRGARGMPIVRDESDRWKFKRSLYYMNDEFLDGNWNRLKFIYSSQTTVDRTFVFRPDHWPERKKLVNIVSYALVSNHFHLLLKEIVENGVSTFMKKLGQSMTNGFNEKYKEVS